MKIISVWWTAYDGGPGQYRFSQAYPDSLKSQLRERGHDLIVLSDTDYGRRLLNPSRYRGWFSKIEVFRPENRDIRPCLCIDLDTFILGRIDPILNLDPNRLWLIREAYRKNRGNSGLFIAPKDGVSEDIWAKASRTSPEGLGKGDGDFLRQFPHLFIQDEVDGILSYKADHLYGSPKNARIVCFHGRPRPAHAEGWAKQFWESHVGIERRRTSGSISESRG